MDEHGPRISRSALARMTGATALGLAVAPERGSRRRAARAPNGHLHRSSVLTDGRAGDVGMDADALEDAFARVARRAADGRFPGAVALVARRGIVVGERAFGVRLAGSSEATTIDTLYDLESMTKVLATSTAAMMLVAPRQALADRTGRQVPARTSPPTARAACSCATSCATRPACPIDNPKVDTDDIDAIWALHGADPARVPDRQPGRVLRSRLPPARPPRSRPSRARDLDAFAKREIWGPLGMTRHDLQPRGRARAALRRHGPGLARAPPRPAARHRCRTTRTGRSAASSAATASFATARDVAIFSQMILNGGCYGDVRPVPK